MEKNLEIIFEQYKICVEMAEKTSSRRMNSNGFFLTLNSALITATINYHQKFEADSIFIGIIFISILGVILCYIWFRLIKSYRQLNTAKFLVIGELEKLLPKSPFYAMEWKMLGEGKDKKLYTPLTALEQRVPFIFMILYILLSIILFLE